MYAMVPVPLSGEPRPETVCGDVTETAQDGILTIRRIFGGECDKSVQAGDR